MPRGPARGPAPLEDGYLSVRALAAYSGMSVRSVRNYLRHPQYPLPHYKMDGMILVKRSEFDAWMRLFKQDGEDRVSALVDELLHEVS